MTTSGLRVVRGGSWYYAQDFSRLGYRDSVGPDARNYDLGFRVCRSAPV